MMIDQSLEMYEIGAMTGHECAIQSLLDLDPADPGGVLKQLPVEVLEQVAESVEHYRPGKQMVTNYGPAPSQEQLAAARKWIRESRRAGKK